MSQGTKLTTVVHDTDIHGLSCGINAYYTLRRQGIAVSVFSHFSTNPQEPSTTPTGLAQYVESLGTTDLIILDIPIDIRNPKRYIDALVSHAQFKGRVLWLDHHGHSQWIDILNKQGVTAIVYGSSYDLALAVPRMYAIADSFVEKWALIGSVADFDTSIADKVSPELEEMVCDILDQAWKQRRDQLLSALGLTPRPELGNVGQFTVQIVEKGIEPEKVIEVARTLVSPLRLPQYNTIGDVVYTTELPAMGLAWKTAWKLCLVTGSKVAVVPTFNPRTQQYAVIIARYWRVDETISKVIESFIATKFAGRQIVGHVGARSIALMSQSEIQNVPMWARELAEELERTVYTPKTVHLVSDRYVASALERDFKMILQKLTEILETQKKMYEEYLELKRRQVQLLEQATERERTRYD